MALGTVSSGSQTCTIDTIHSVVAAHTTAGIYVAKFNLATLVNGDIIRLFVTNKVLTGDTEGTEYEGIYANDLGENHIVSTPPFVSMFSCSVKIEQTDGTGRSIPWSFVRVQEY